jgi:hypothetical protein
VSPKRRQQGGGEAAEVWFHLDAVREFPRDSAV